LGAQFWMSNFEGVNFKGMIFLAVNFGDVTFGDVYCGDGSLVASISGSRKTACAVDRFNHARRKGR
jgi:hypothetical protein